MLVSAAVASAGLVGLGDTPVHALDNGLAKTPPMGWNSWNTFGCDINENMIKEMADAMVTSGMKDAGYQYVNIDDCWQAQQRDDRGRLQADPQRFPHGMAALADYIHQRGLKFGIYSTAGTGTCQSRPGSLGHENVDAQTFASWGVDYLKYDHCYTEKAALPDIDRVTVSGNGADGVSYEAEAASLSGTAKIVSCSGCSGGQRVGGLGDDKGAVSFSVNAPAAGTYQLDVSYVYGADPRTSYYPTGYVSVNGQWRSDRLRFTPSPGSQTPADYRLTVDLHAGDNTVRLDNPMTGLAVKQENFAAMRDALGATGRPIVYSINPNTQDGTSFAGIANLWRTTQDIKPLWHSTSWYRGLGDIIEENGPLAADAGPGHWNDPDMLEVGVKIDGFPGLTPTEERTQMSMWSMMAAPLIAGNDLRGMPEEIRRLLANREVIAVDQDPAGRQGTKVADEGGREVWTKRLADGTRAVALFNSGAEPATISADRSELGLRDAPNYIVRDLWAHDQRTNRDGSVSASVEPHGVAMFRIKPEGRVAAR